MNIQEINEDIISYLRHMISNDENYDIDNLTENDFDGIVQTYLNDWEQHFDIITEYYGNTNTFTPSLDAFVEMMDLITKMRTQCDCDTDWNMFAKGKNNFHRYCVVLRHYAYHYAHYIGCETFIEKLKGDNFDYENSCDCCLKSWTDTKNEYGFCSCICSKCGDDLRNCKYECWGE
jgi:hypothetical protein